MLSWLGGGVVQTSPKEEKRYFYELSGEKSSAIKLILILFNFFRNLNFIVEKI